MVPFVADSESAAFSVTTIGQPRSYRPIREVGHYGFVRSIKEECLNRVIPLGEGHFRRTLAEFVAHYHRERNHQGLGNELIDGNPDARHSGAVRRRQRLGGLLSFYHRAA